MTLTTFFGWVRTLIVFNHFNWPENEHKLQLRQLQKEKRCFTQRDAMHARCITDNNYVNNEDAGSRLHFLRKGGVCVGGRVKVWGLNWLGGQFCCFVGFVCVWDRESGTFVFSLTTVSLITTLPNIYSGTTQQLSERLQVRVSSSARLSPHIMAVYSLHNCLYSDKTCR